MRVIGASLSEPHIDRDNVPRRGEAMYVAACSVCRLNVPENTPNLLLFIGAIMEGDQEAVIITE